MSRFTWPRYNCLVAFLSRLWRQQQSVDEASETRGWYMMIELYSAHSSVILVWDVFIARTHVCVRNDSETHETVLLDCTTCVLAFITHILCINGIEMTFIWLIYYTLRYIFFKFAICFIALMNLGEIRHLKRRDLATVWRTMLLLCCHHCDWMQQHYDVTQFK